VIYELKWKMELIEKCRRVQHIGRSYYIALPQNWVNSLGLKQGSLVKCSIAESGDVIIKK
jgi:antitoxin component of MazEF toxin-antitoxin module